MKDIKKMILILAIIFVVIIMIIIVLNKRNTNSNGTVNEVEIIEADIPGWDSEENKFNNVNSRINFYTAERCIKTFYVNYSEAFLVGEDDEYYEETLQRLYSLLDNEYIEMYGVTAKNIKEKMPEYEFSTIDITKMYVQQVSDNVCVYFAYGNLINKETSEATALAVGVKIDKANRTFSILPYEYMKNNNYMNVEKGTYIELKKVDSIENKTNNTYDEKYLSDEEYLTILFDKYRDRIVFNKEEAYNSLDKEYREKRFGSLEAYIEYLNDNIIELYTSKFAKYKTAEYDEYIQYVCLDKDEDYYIFRETSPFNYGLILDTYTIDLPEFVEKYEVSTEQEKVALNIQKVIEAINAKDYNYVYRNLDETFKQNKFGSLNKFEEYMEKEFFDESEITYLSYKEINGLHTYSTVIRNSEGEGTVSKTFIMELGEGTNFVMSFNV